VSQRQTAPRSKRNPQNRCRNTCTIIEIAITQIVYV
jgi:hypothetical protein